MLNFASQEINCWEESNNCYESSPVPAGKKSAMKIGSVKLFADKIRVPTFAAPVARPRLIEHLKKSRTQFSATLINGRAGMGKTILAADFAGQIDCQTVWYKVENADTDWKVFASYLLGSLKHNCPDFNLEEFNAANFGVSAMAEILAAQFNCAAEVQDILIALDDLHTVFDTVWFTEFFNSFVPSLSPNVHLLMISRTLPPLQIWRLRSKQVLGVIDEELLTFNLEETKKFFRNYKLSALAARSAHKRTYGRIAKLEEIAEKKAFA